jgi:hypothetical protein
LASLETECKIHDGYVVEDPFGKFEWIFFSVNLGDKLVCIIEKYGMMKGFLGHAIGAHMTDFVGNYLESKGCNARIKKINYVADHDCFQITSA